MDSCLLENRGTRELFFQFQVESCIFDGEHHLLALLGRGSLEPESSSEPQEAQALVQTLTLMLFPVRMKTWKPASVPFSQLLFLLAVCTCSQLISVSLWEDFAETPRTVTSGLMEGPRAGKGEEKQEEAGMGKGVGEGGTESGCGVFSPAPCAAWRVVKGRP